MGPLLAVFKLLFTFPQGRVQSIGLKNLLNNNYVHTYKRIGAPIARILDVQMCKCRIHFVMHKIYGGTYVAISGRVGLFVEGGGMRSLEITVGETSSL